MRTDIIAILDESGSMSHLRNDTIGGFNEFIKKQREIPGEARVTLVTFNTGWRTVYSRVPLAEVPLLSADTYAPGGGTALLDAIGLTMNEHGAFIASDKGKWTEKVLVLITTDGEENSSREFTKAKIKEMIEHAEKVGGWEFLYLSANPTAFADASSIGLGANSTAAYNHTANGTQSLYAAASASVGGSRSMGKAMHATLDDLKLAGGGLDEGKLLGQPAAQSQPAANVPPVKPARLADLSQSTSGTPAP